MNIIRKTYEIPAGRKTRLRKELRGNGYSVANEPTAEIIYKDIPNHSLDLASMPKGSLEVSMLDLSRSLKRSETPQSDFEDASQALDEFLSELDLS